MDGIRVAISIALSAIAAAAYALAGVFAVSATADEAKLIIARPLPIASMMQLCVFLRAHHPKVEGIVVLLVPVDVMNHFVGGQFPAKDALHNDTMFEEIAAFFLLDDNIASGVLRATTPPVRAFRSPFRLGQIADRSLNTFGIGAVCSIAASSAAESPPSLADATRMLLESRPARFADALNHGNFRGHRKAPFGVTPPAAYDSAGASFCLSAV